MYPYAKYKPEKAAGSDVEPDEVKIELAEKIIVLDTAKNYANVKPLIKDFSQDFKQGEQVNVENLRAKAVQYIKSSGMGTPKINIEVSFVNLAQTAEYESIRSLEQVALCDTVTVRFKKLGINAKAKVIRTVYDCLREKYITIELGDAKSSFADTLHDITNGITSVITQVKDSSSKLTEQLEKAILDATNAITGNSGGHIVFRPAKNPQEILIMDTADTKTAVNVWRWNLSGMGHSSSGVNGKFNLAFLANGQINAEVVFAKKLSGIYIEAGTIAASALSIDYRKSVTDKIDGVNTDLSQKFEVANGKFTSAIAEKLGKDEFETTFGQTSRLFKFSLGEQNDTTYITKDGVTVKHADGSYTNISSRGLMHLLGGAEKPYHYLCEVGIVSSGALTSYTYTLPADFKGKDFKVITSIKDLPSKTANYKSLSVFSANCEVTNVDTVNARFTVRTSAAYGYYPPEGGSTFTSGSLPFSFIAVA